MRGCGECGACCTVMRINEIQKPTGARCPYQREGVGCCTIYDTPEKPRGCSDFECEWLMGLGTDEHRPDKLGVLMFPPTREMVTSGLRVLMCCEVREGAFENPLWDAMEKTLAGMNWAMMLVPSGGLDDNSVVRKIAGDAMMIQKFKSFSALRVCRSAQGKLSDN